MDRREQRRVRAVAAAEAPDGQRPTSRGGRYESASATCSGSTTSESGERGDRSRDPGDPRPTTTRERQPLDGPVEQLRRGRGATGLRRGEPRSRSLDPRPRPSRRARPAARPGPRPAGAASATTRSMRSSRARETRSRYAATRDALQEQSSRGSPSAPHGQRFIVATRRNRAGKVARPPDRATDTTPSSSGCRSASSTVRGNSGSSSSSSTPRCASVRECHPTDSPSPINSEVET